MDVSSCQASDRINCLNYKNLSVKQLALVEMLYPDLSVAPSGCRMVRRVFQPHHPRLTPPGSPFLSGLHALDRWFSTLSRGLTSANISAPEYRPAVRASVLFLLVPENTSGVLLRRGLAHQVFESRLNFFGYRQVPQLRIYAYPRAISKSTTFLL